MRDPQKGSFMKKFALSLLSIILCAAMLVPGTACVFAADTYKYPYLDPTLSADERARDLLSRMSVDEKIAQCVQGDRNCAPADRAGNLELGSILSGGGSAPGDTTLSWRNMLDGYQNALAKTKWGIPIIYGTDSVHGHNNLKNATIFPHNIGLGAANNPELVEKIAHATAIETAATGVYWAFGPCVASPQNIRWGRTYEGYSQDIDIVTSLSAAYVRGLQGTDPDAYKNADTIAASIKHFALEGNALNGKNQGNVSLPQDYQTNEEYIENVLMPALAPYKAAIDEGALTVMASFNRINELSCHQNYFLLTTILKERLGFEGFVIGDYCAHVYLTPGEHNAEKYSDCKLTKSEADEIYSSQDSMVKKHVACFNAGLDMFMSAGTTERVTESFNALRTGYDVGLISDSRLDNAVYRILRVKFLLGLFDERRFTNEENVELAAKVRSDEHLDLARQAVRESLVLLKNDNDIVGKFGENRKIFVCGKSADDLGYQCGGWTLSWQGAPGNNFNGTTILNGLKKLAGDREIIYSKDGSGSAGCDIAVAVLGEAPYAEMYGDADSKTLALDEADSNVLAKLKAENPDIPVLVILVSGRPMLIGDKLADIDGVIAAWLPGTEGDGIAEVLFDAKYDFVGKLPFDWPADYYGIDNTPTLGETLDNVPLWQLGYGLKKGETKAPWENPFNDVNENDWFFGAVKEMNENEFMNGTSDNEFSPNGSVTRAMFVTVLYRMEGKPKTSFSDFTDVSSVAYYAKAVAWAKNAGIVGGVSEKLFAPDSKITREQMAAIMYRYAEYKKADISSSADIGAYSDYAKVSAYAADALSWTVGTGILKGKSGSTLNPGESATRAEAAAVLARVRAIV